MDADEVALEALARGHGEPFGRSAFPVGDLKAVAVDAHHGVAAVLVISHPRDDEWIVDVVRFVDQDGTWRSLGAAGSAFRELPIHDDPTAHHPLGPVQSGWSMLEDTSLVYAGGFVGVGVEGVEVVAGDLARRVPVAPGSLAFAVALPADAEVDDIDVRALDAGGAVIDSTAMWEAERRAALPGVTVAEALALPDGTSVTVRGLLLALPGQPALLCEDLEAGTPQRCQGPQLVLAGDAPWPPTAFEDASVSTVMMVVSGVLRAGVLTPASL